MKEQWQELKETIVKLRDGILEFRDGDGTGTQQEVCKFLVDLMDVLENQESCEDCISRQSVEEMIKTEMPERGMWEIEGDKEKETVCEVCVDLMQKLSDLPPVTPQQKVGHCNDCKWWKDSDGSYNRGIGAESQCPMNRIEVFDGTGYCFLYEPHESEE